MVRSPSIDKNGMKKGAWSEDEDRKLKAYVERYGHWNWRQIPKFAGLSRCGKSCRLRWLNYLKPDVRRGSYSKEEEDTILKLHDQLGKKWSVIAKELPGRTDNEIKNYWHTHLKKRSQNTENPILSSNKEMKKRSEKTENPILSSHKEMEESSNTCTYDQGSHENSSLIFEEMNQESSQDLPIPVHRQSTSTSPEQSSCSIELSSDYLDAPLSDLMTWTGEDNISSFEYSLSNLWRDPIQTGYDYEETIAAYDFLAPLVGSGLLNQLSPIFGDEFLWSYDLGHEIPLW